VPVALAFRVLERDGLRCVYCGSTKALSVDHVTPRSWAGSNAPRNLVAACSPCNSTRKGDLDLRCYAEKLRGLGMPEADVRAMITRVRSAQRRQLP
jgi:5-methylcytosine-specific restriction endonuclease McrA